VRFLPLGAEGGLLLDEPGRRVVALNTTAAVIWCLLPDARDRDSLAAALAARARLGPARAGAFVDAALADWGGQGLLDGTSPPDPAPPVPGPPRRPYPAGARFAAERRYVLRRRRLAVRFTHGEDADLVHPALAHLAAGPGPADASIEVVRGPGGGVAVYADGAWASSCDAPDGLAVPVTVAVARTALAAGGYLLSVHAGVVGGPSGCVLLPAPSGSGKTTLTAALVRRGHAYFSDEVAPLAADTLEVEPFPLALCVKETGRAALARLFPEVEALPVHARSDGKRVAYLPPPAASLPAGDARRPVAAIVFPRYRPGAGCRARPLATGEALARLLGQGVGLPPAFGLAELRRLAGWIGRLPCHELAFGSPAEAASAVEGLAGLAAAGPAAP
jgi:hypothetical protein